MFVPQSLTVSEGLRNALKQIAAKYPRKFRGIFYIFKKKY
ncbi:hypothetical protein EUBSIR_02635 [[Eubacterium] siraeum DSM 15702]|uniref:Uncharacterized protein n=1 Tax=[Eubacterium] siraeum DSM 15702 TaxID=428128 RepID=B0MRZ9_9FIRM|nr:hypothetical protein EUBSIR_02635 [[Eubacterium] siraeum DSM 15702]